MNPGRRATRLFIIIALVLISSIAVAYVTGGTALRALQSTARHRAVREELYNAISVMKDAETGQRGYVLTGEDSYLLPFEEARNRIHDEIGRLQKLADSGDLNRADTDEFSRLARNKLAELEESIRLRRTGDAAASLALVKTGTGKQMMDDLRSLVGRLVNQETSEIAASETLTRRTTLMRTAVFILVPVINLGFLFWAYRRLSREAEQRAASARRWEVTLRSIGDGVILTDRAGNIEFINEIAQKLTGWGMPEAAGKPCREIFHIVNETSRDIVESPVDKVLRLGHVVGLANHTVLIRRDGSEVPIDDSGAPVREDTGEIRGVVLVFRDFSEHKRSEHDLRSARDAAEEANRKKDHFLAMLSHELRTPLTPVIATLAAWQGSHTFPIELRRDLDMVYRNAELEARLIDDLLDLNRIVKGKLSLDIQPTDVHAILNAVVDMCRSELYGKQLQFELHINATRFYTLADPARLQQAFWNVLKNAIKFTRTSGKIRIVTENPSDAIVRIRCIDDGIGMSQDTITKIFRPFQQAEEDLVRRAGGLGLGMAISDALLRAQGGSIRAESEGVDRGSSFTIDLSLTDAPVQTAPQPKTPASDPDRIRSLRVHLVEDHPDTADVMARLLEIAGHSVKVSTTVADAISVQDQGEFDLLISDVGLPDGNGMDLIRHIRARKSTPAIALTGFGMEDDVNRCKEAGFDAHLTKPVNFPKLETLINKVTSTRN